MRTWSQKYTTQAESISERGKLLYKAEKILSCVTTLERETNKGTQWHQVLADTRFTFKLRKRAGTGKLTGVCSEAVFPSCSPVYHCLFQVLRDNSKESLSLLILKRPIYFLQDDHFCSGMEVSLQG